MLLTSQGAVAQVLRLFRNVLVARVLSPADFGVAATFWITTGFLDVISSLGFKQWLIQSPDGDDEQCAASVQTMMTCRSALIALAIFSLAGPIANLFDAPETAWAFRLLAVVPFLGGFVHRDITRFERHLRFAPAVLSKMGPDVVTTALAWPIVRHVGDYSAFVWLAIIRTSLSVTVSHLVAERRFRLSWDPSVVRKIFSFGWPLLLNSVLMFAAMQGDRVVLAKGYTKSELGVYSIAVGLVMSVYGLLSGTLGRIALPVLSGSRDNVDLHDSRFRLYLQASTALTLAAGAACSLAGPWVTHVLYGQKYAMAGTLVGWLAVMYSMKMLRGASTTLAMARGDTKSSLYMNLWRSGSMVLLVLAAIQHLPVVWIAIAGIAGELVALCCGVPGVARRHGFSMWLILKPAMIVIALLTPSAALANALPRDSHWSVWLGAFLGAEAICMTVVLLISPQLRQQVLSILADWKRRLAERTRPESLQCSVETVESVDNAQESGNEVRRNGQR